MKASTQRKKINKILESNKYYDINLLGLWLPVADIPKTSQLYEWLYEVDSEGNNYCEVCEDFVYRNKIKVIDLEDGRTSIYFSNKLPKANKD